MKTSYLAMTGYEGPAPGFEIWPAESSYCEPVVAANSVQRTLELCEFAEALGFDAITVAEHHYAPYMMTPNPMIMAAAIIQRVSRPQINIFGPLVPLTNPVRIAEELAMLDVMSNGRITVMPLRGTANEHKTYDTPPEHTRAMTQEGIDLILKAWTQTKPFSWKSEHYAFSTISVWQRVLQQPHPQMFGSGNSEESIAFAASRRLGIGFSFAPLDFVQKGVAQYREACAREGWEPRPSDIVYRGIAYLAQTDEAAEAGVAAHFARKAEESSKLQSETLGGPQLNDLIMQRPMFVGSPDTVLAAFEALYQAGVGMADVVYSLGGDDEQRRSMELTAQHILPQAQSWEDRFHDAAIPA